MHSTQVVFVDGRANSPSEALTGILVGSKMDSAVDARAADVVGDLFKRGVLQDNGRSTSKSALKTPRKYL